MKSWNYNKYYELSLGILVFLMILVPSLVGVGIIILLAVWVFGIIKREVEFKFNFLNLLLLVFYVVYLFGVLYTNNMDLAGKYLEYKMALILFPVVFSFMPKNKLSLRIPALFMIAATAIVSIIGLFSAVLLYNETGNVKSLLSTSVSFIHHPTYLSLYAAFCCAILIYGLKSKWIYFTKRNVLFLFFFFFVAQILCVSLAGVLFILSYIVYLTFSTIKKRLSNPIFIAFVCATFLALFSLVKFTPEIGDQMVNSLGYLTEYMEDPDEFIRSKQTYVGGSETRLILWTAAFKVVRENPFGVGTGNVDDSMTEMLNRIGQPNMAIRKLNPHNQYFQTAIEVGMVGLFFLLAIIFFGLYYAILNKNWLLLFILISLAFNCLFESILQRQSGIVFYTFWISLLLLIDVRNEKVIKE
ncbi:MAG: O-antigen ligase family protein [Flavobacteriales bacterium]|nr:O-antigen ligase family protein [Flavobacteriales bacterium]